MSTNLGRLVHTSQRFHKDSDIWVTVQPPSLVNVLAFYLPAYMQSIHDYLLTAHELWAVQSQMSHKDLNVCSSCTLLYTVWSTYIRIYTYICNSTTLFDTFWLIQYCVCVKFLYMSVIVVGQSGVLSAGTDGWVPQCGDMDRSGRDSGG